MSSEFSTIRDLFRERECKCVKLDPSHGRFQAKTQDWLRQDPSEVAEAIALDCNSISIY
jgi:hypothetical protein